MNFPHSGDGRTHTAASHIATRPDLHIHVQRRNARLLSAHKPRGNRQRIHRLWLPHRHLGCTLLSLMVRSKVLARQACVLQCEGPHCGPAERIWLWVGRAPLRHSSKIQWAHTTPQALEPSGAWPKDSSGDPVGLGPTRWLPVHLPQLHQPTCCLSAHLKAENLLIRSP